MGYVLLFCFVRRKVPPGIQHNGTCNMTACVYSITSVTMAVQLVLRTLSCRGKASWDCQIRAHSAKVVVSRYVHMFREMFGACLFSTVSSSDILEHPCTHPKYQLPQRSLHRPEPNEKWRITASSGHPQGMVAVLTDLPLSHVDTLEP